MPHLEWETYGTGHTCQCDLTGKHDPHVCSLCTLEIYEAQFEQMRQQFQEITDAQHDEMVSRYGGRN